MARSLTPSKMDTLKPAFTAAHCFTLIAFTLDLLTLRTCDKVFKFFPKTGIESFNVIDERVISISRVRKDGLAATQAAPFNVRVMDEMLLLDTCERSNARHAFTDSLPDTLWKVVYQVNVFVV